MGSPIFLNVIIILLASIILSSLLSYAGSDVDKKKLITLNAIFEDQGDPERWKTLIQPAIDEM